MLVASTSPLRAAPHRRAARGADVSLPLDHAGCDAINVGNTLPAQALRVTLTGSPLLGSALGGGRIRYERYSPYGGEREKRWDRIMHEIQNFSFLIYYVAHPVGLSRAY
jgi:hypothetical protein